MAQEEKKIPVYYEKPMVELGSVEPGTYVFDSDAQLCYVDEGYRLHRLSLEYLCSKDTIVYPISLETQRIMEKMAAHRDKYHKGNIMNADFSRELEAALFDLMSIDIYDADYGKKEAAIWERLEKRYNELVEHAKALHIFRG